MKKERHAPRMLCQEAQRLGAEETAEKAGTMATKRLGMHDILQKTQQLSGAEYLHESASETVNMFTQKCMDQQNVERLNVQLQHKERKCEIGKMYIKDGDIKDS